MKQVRPYPQAIVTRKAAKALSAGHPWVYASEVLRLEPAQTDGRVAENGDLVDVREENGTWQGTGLLSERSTIRVRIVSRNANDRFDEAFWRRRIAWAWQHRVATMGPKALCGREPDTTCCRMVFSEADGIPGLVVDKYDKVLVSQVGTVGIHRLRPMLYPLLLDVLRESGEQVQGIYERNDGAVRDKEGLPREQGWWSDVPHGDTRIEVRENGIRYRLDLEHSQKTGFFLDQKYNRRAVRSPWTAASSTASVTWGRSGSTPWPEAPHRSVSSTRATRPSSSPARTPRSMGSTARTELPFPIPAPTCSSTCRGCETAGGFASRGDPSTSSCSIRPRSPRAARRCETRCAAIGTSMPWPCGYYLAVGIWQPAAARTSWTATGSHRRYRKLRMPRTSSSSKSRSGSRRRTTPSGFPESHYLDFFVFQVV